MHERPRYPAATLEKKDIPLGPGAYAWYERGRVVYVGKGDNLQRRIWRCHLGRGADMGNSALRRNVAEDLGFGSAAAIKEKACQLTADQVAEVNARVRTWSVAWILCATSQEALLLEDQLKSEWLPPLTKR
jgi:hypothetical protein